MKQWLKLCLPPLLFSISASSFAAMSLDRMIVYFDPDKTPRQDVVVSNPDSENLYLQTEVYKVLKPGTAEEERVKITDPNKMMLLSTPQKAIIPPNSRKTVRLVSLETPKEIESVYRVTFKPVVGDLKATQNAIKLLIAYQALVFIRPENPEYKVTAKRDGSRITFTNSGNINVVLRNGKFCDKEITEESCTDIEAGTRLYAGQSWSLDMPDKTTKVQYGLFNGRNEERAVF